VTVIDIGSIEPVKSMLIQVGEYAYYCDMYFPKDEGFVIGSIIPDEEVEWGDQKVQVSLIKSNGVVIHELGAMTTVKDFMFNVQIARELEQSKTEALFQTFKTTSPPEGRDYA